jgi:hypothetical protein
MTGSRPSTAEVAAGITLAAHAPSVHNTQPWQWRMTSSHLELYADAQRRLQVADPFGRLLLMSCGANLHHFSVAMGSRGWASEITRFPDPHKPGLLASVAFSRSRPSSLMSAWAEAVSLRRTDRRPMSSCEIPDAYIRRFAELAAEHGAFAQPLTADQVDHWENLVQQVKERRGGLPEYRQELSRWTHRADRTRAGVAAGRFRQRLEPEPVGPEQVASRLQREDVDDTAAGRPLSLLLTTSSDDSLGRLRAGEAMSAVLLEATSLGLATSIDSQAIEVETIRSRIESGLLRGSRSPQVLVRAGWPSSADPLPATPRRPTQEILRPG